jgi:restriction endonuclease NotI
VAIDQGFFKTLPTLPSVDQHEADIAWLIYDLRRNAERKVYQLTLMQTVYTHFEPALTRITTAEPGPIEHFIRSLQRKLNRRLDSSPPDAPTLADIALT